MDCAANTRQRHLDASSLPFLLRRTIPPYLSCHPNFDLEDGPEAGRQQTGLILLLVHSLDEGCEDLVHLDSPIPLLYKLIVRCVLVQPLHDQVPQLFPRVLRSTKLQGSNPIHFLNLLFLLLLVLLSNFVVLLPRDLALLQRRVQVLLEKAFKAILNESWSNYPAYSSPSDVIVLLVMLIDLTANLWVLA